MNEFYSKLGRKLGMMLLFFEIMERNYTYNMVLGMYPC